MMKTLKCSLCVALVAGLGSMAVMLLTRSPRTLTAESNEVAEANERSYEAEPNQEVVYQPKPSAKLSVRRLVPAIPLTPDKTDVPVADITPKPADAMRVRADQVLAKVNDRAILLADLVPLRPDEQEQAMTAEEYESRLNRAIELELTFQTAAVRGVDLTPEQKRRVEGVAQRHEATLQEYRKEGVTWSSFTTTQLEFEQRLTAALMLQQNLVALEAHIAPASDSNVQAHYEQALLEILGRLKANGNITVSSAKQ